jgi:hypothetical protein
MYNYESYLRTQEKLTESTLHHGMAYLAKLPLAKNSSGLVSPSQTIQLWVSREDKPFISGIIAAFRTNSRMQLYTGKQTVEPYKRFNKLVPLVLSAFKEYNDIGYSKWDWRDPAMQYLLDKDTYDLVPYILGQEAVPDFTVAEKLSLIDTLDVDKYTITKKDCPQLYGFPLLLKHILLQTWACSPKHRHPLMILDVKKLDTVPDSIYGDLELFNKPASGQDNEDPFKLEQINVPVKKQSPKLQKTPEQEAFEKELWGF